MTKAPVFTNDITYIGKDATTKDVEHPELVAERLIRFGELVGPDNVIASTDCGLGGRVHEQIAWAKLETLVEGTEIANKHFGL